MVSKIAHALVVAAVVATAVGVALTAWWSGVAVLAGFVLAPLTEVTPRAGRAARLAVERPR